MANVETEGHGVKPSQSTTSGDRPSSKSPATCYLTRGRFDNEWHVWNTSPVALVVEKGDSLHGYLVASGFEDATCIAVRAVEDFTVSGKGSKTCVLEREISFPDPVGDLESVATQVALEDMCVSKGVKCALFLEHYTQSPGDEELQLGSRVCSLFVHTVREMLHRKYDVMHHYPLFNRALGLHYSAEAHSNPPELKDMVAAGGLLDRSVEEHQTLHGIPLAGVDHVSFSRWNYPDDDEREERQERDGRGDGGEGCSLDPREPQESRGRDRDGGEGCSSDLHEPQESRGRDGRGDGGEGCSSDPRDSTERQTALSVSPCPQEDSEDALTADTLQTFNNLPGALTDGPAAFPYLFTVHTSKELKFDDLVSYCVARTHEPLRTLPPRGQWGAVNPVLLMEDPVDPATGTTVHRYKVTSRGYLSTVTTNPRCCYNEVFLPGRPVSRLNLDIDLKCCQRCNGKFALGANRSVKRQVSKAMAASLILVIVESLLRLGKVKRSELESDPSLRQLADAAGKIAAYIRVSPTKSKLSLRMLWYLPVELCSRDGIEAYGPLLVEMEKVSLSYVLLSYPSDAESCGLCDLGHVMRRAGRDNSSGARHLRWTSYRTENRRSSVDKAPYSFRKSVRLPNGYKEDSGFEYVDTFNTQGIEDPGFEDPLSLSVGLSSNPILVDVTSLGSRFRGVLRPGGCSRSSPAVSCGLREVPDRARVESEARRLASLWGVPVTIRRTGSGLFCVQANEKSTTYPCPIHDRVHSKSRLGALIFTTQTTPKCFVP